MFPGIPETRCLCGWATLAPDAARPRRACDHALGRRGMRAAASCPGSGAPRPRPIEARRGPTRGAAGRQRPLSTTSPPRSGTKRSRSWGPSRRREVDPLRTLLGLEPPSASPVASDHVSPGRRLERAPIAARLQAAGPAEPAGPSPPRPFGLSGGLRHGGPAGAAAAGPSGSPACASTRPGHRSDARGRVGTPPRRRSEACREPVVGRAVLLPRGLASAWGLQAVGGGSLSGGGVPSRLLGAARGLPGEAGRSSVRRSVC
jgi:hypothetical protein